MMMLLLKAPLVLALAFVTRFVFQRGAVWIDNKFHNNFMVNIFVSTVFGSSLMFFFIILLEGIVKL